MDIASVVVGTVWALLSGGTSPAGAAISFHWLGDLPGGEVSSIARAVSADGSAVVGHSGSASGWEAFRWTETGGMQGLGDLPGGGFDSRARAVSDDGRVVVGTSASASGMEAFLWTEMGGMLGLGDLPGGPFSSWAYGVSGDGTVVVGDSWSIPDGLLVTNEAFRWTQAEGMQPMGFLPGGYFSTGFGVSGDGSVIVGSSVNDQQKWEAFRWTQAGGMQGLGDLPGEPFGSHARAVSPDGSTVVGLGNSFSGAAEAFRWTESGGMLGLGHLPGGASYSESLAVSADGSVVVGSGYTDSGREAFIWDAAHGMRNLREALIADYGLALPGALLGEATGVSADGTTIVGYGWPAFPYTGNPEAWMAVVPEPATLFVMGCGAIGLLRRRRSKIR